MNPLESSTIIAPASYVEAPLSADSTQPSEPPQNQQSDPAENVSTARPPSPRGYSSASQVHARQAAQEQRSRLSSPTNTNDIGTEELEQSDKPTEKVATLEVKQTDQQELAKDQAISQAVAQLAYALGNINQTAQKGSDQL